MKTLRRLVVLAVVGTLVYLGVLYGRRWLGMDTPSLAKRLPDSTLSWVCVQDTDSLVAGIGGDSAIQKFLELIGEGPDAVTFFKDYLGEGLDSGTASRFAGWLREAKSVNLVFQGVAIRRGGPLPKLSLIIELPSKSAATGAADKLRKVFPDRSEHGKGTLCTLDRKLADEADAVVPCMGLQGKYLLFSLDQADLEASLDMLDKPSGNPLAKDKGFRHLAKGTAKMGSYAWVSPKLVDEVLGLVGKRKQEEVRATLQAAGLDKLVGLWVASKQADGKGVLRLGVAPEGKLAKTFALSSMEYDFASITPEDTWFSAAVCLEDGEKLWQRVGEYLYGIMKASGTVNSLSEFNQQMEAFEAGLGVTPEELFAAVSAMGFCLSSTQGMPSPCLFLRTKDMTKAENLLWKLAEKRGARRGQEQVLKAAGKEIHCLRNAPSYVALDDVLCVALVPDALKALAESAAAGRVLAKTANYQSVAGRLPKAAAIRLFFDLGKCAQEKGMGATPVPPALLKGDGAKKMAMGLSLQAKDGTFELATATPPATVFGSLFSDMMLQSLAEARNKARQISDCSNLKQLALAVMMYSNDHDDHFPTDLGELLQYVGDTSVFRCPAAGRRAPEDARAIARGNCDYVYLKPATSMARLRNPSETPILATRPGLLSHDGINVAYADGHVMWHSTHQLPVPVRRALDKALGPTWMRQHVGKSQR